VLAVRLLSLTVLRLVPRTPAAMARRQRLRERP